MTEESVKNLSFSSVSDPDTIYTLASEAQLISGKDDTQGYITSTLNWDEVINSSITSGTCGTYT